MLAGVSHDLRTILTRFKLEMALIGDSPEVEGMRKDVDEMSGMLEAYLAFARGDSAARSGATDRYDGMRWKNCAATPSATAIPRPCQFHGLPGRHR